MGNKMKPSFYAGQSALTKSQRAENAATKSFTAGQDAKAHQGRKQVSFAMPAKKQSNDSVGKYVGGDPFRKLK